MADPTSEFLQSVGIDESDLDREGYSGEMEELNRQIEAIETMQVTPEKLKDYIEKSKMLILKKLSSLEVKTGNWLSALSFFIPIIGLVRKWYEDQERIRLEIQLEVYTSIEELLLAPDKRRRVLQERLIKIKSSKG